MTDSDSGTTNLALDDVSGDTLIYDVIEDPAFEGYGRLLFPVTYATPTRDMTLSDLYLPWYSNIRTDETVDVVRYLLEKRAQGNTVFYDIYTDAEKAADPSLNDTGLFFFRAQGVQNAPFAVVNSGGGFAYVASMHDSFPHALHLSRAGYNAFALQYRPDAQLACEDLSRALQFIFENAEELGVNTDGYSLWGGSAGARMATNVGAYGTSAFGSADLPKPAAVIMQYTGHSQIVGTEPATYACVGTNDGIANWRTMQSRLDRMAALGIPTEFHVYDGLSHGFGLGTGTVAEGWIDDAIAFWEAITWRL